MNHDPRIEIVGDAAIKVRGGTNDQLAPLLSNTQPTDDGLLVHWTLDNAVRLGLAGFDPPTPFRHFYKWHIQPYQHQVRTAEFITAHMRCGVWNEQGTGKTIAAVAACDYLLLRKRVRRVLVLCPVSVMYSAWVNDFAVAAPHRQVGVAHGTLPRRLDVLKSPAEIVVMNFDGLLHVETDKLLASDFDMIVIDEANAFKNHTIRRYKALVRLIKPETRVVLLTGTPASQSPVDAYGLSRLLGNSQCPKYFSTWRDAVMVQQSRFVWSPKADAAQRVNEILKPSIRFTKEQCLDLPERVYLDRHVALSKEQLDHYTRLKKEMLLDTERGEITAANAAVLLGKLLQISSGVVYANDREPIALDYTSRFTELINIIEQTTEKVLVFALFRGIIEDLTTRLNAAGVPAMAIHGDVSAHERRNLIFQFQQTDHLRVLVLQPQAAAHGLTLTRADTTVWWSPTMSVEMYKQANDRFHRIGQTQRCTVIHLTGSAAETKVYSTLRRNINVHEAAVSLFTDIARS
jgi:SNF2 family DNA or RNA helicase